MCVIPLEKYYELKLQKSISAEGTQRHTEKPVQWKETIFQVSREPPISFSKWVSALMNKSKMCSQSTSKHREVLEVTI